MGRVYGHMMLAVLTSMLTSHLVASNAQLMSLLFGTPVKWVVLFLPLVFVFFVPSLLNSGISKYGKVLVLHAFAGIMGLSMSAAIAFYSATSIATAFMGAAVLFGVMSFYGYFTKKNLDSLGQFMVIGLIAIVIASIINIFVGSTLFQMVISALAIIIFLGLTAYDTQKIREELTMDFGDTTSAELSGALTLYLDFINLFMNLLSLTGVKSDD
jgi:FtsH-binding integral membrane protein